MGGKDLFFSDLITFSGELNIYLGLEVLGINMVVFMSQEDMERGVPKKCRL